MTPAKQQKLLAGQTNVARKLYELVPIEVSWSEFDIFKTLRNSGASAGLHTVRACLLDMKDVGLIKEPSRGMFQRVVIDVVPVTVVSTSPPPSQATMKTAITKRPQPTAMELIAAVSADLLAANTAFAKTINLLATRIDEAALAVEAQREADAEAMAKYRQLQELLKSMGTAA